MHCSRLVAPLIIACIYAATVQAIERGFEFSGTVETVFSDPFGLTLSPDDVVTGRFVYENTSPLTHSPTCDCAGYRQVHINGFWAEFNGERVQADDYVIEIANDVENLGTTNDIVTIRFSSDLDPAPELPLLVNGSPETVGQFSISLFASSELYSDTSLPSELDPADFSFATNGSILSDGGLFTVPDVLFTLDDLETVSQLSSDHDLDDDVDGRDFLIWQRYFGQAGQNGDANSDFEVDDLDLVLWQSQYGSNAPLQSLLVVPEPSSNALLCPAFVVAFYIGTGRWKRLRIAGLNILHDRYQRPQFDSQYKPRCVVGIYPGRAACCYRDHRHSCRPALASHSSSTRVGTSFLLSK